MIDDIWGFDPAVFAITPREARQMDPQQRILLQLVWEALEDAGISPSDVSGKKVGVYVGASSMDYSHRQFFDPAGTDSYLMTGNTLSLISNRVSYIFDLQGPSLTIDTACSSSLVALDYAAQDLRAGRIDPAIVGGVNALLSPFNYMGFCAASMLSPDGLCRPFDHRGNGYVRAEGGVVMLLQREDCQSLKSTKYYGDIVASAMNSDGKTSGVALPSSQQQAALLHTLYETSGIDPNRLAFVEAHGTGTLVGDPAEAGALGRSLGAHRSAPLPIGSAKSNVGHLEPASGIVGLLKAQLALEHGKLPRTLHIEKLNPHIPFDDLNLAVAVDPVELGQGTDKPLLAGVNNFGFGGTNVHVIISAPDENRKSGPLRQETQVKPIRIETAKRDRPTENLFIVSANCLPALRQQAAKYSALIYKTTEQQSLVKWQDLAAAAANRRDRLPHRLIVTGSTANDLAARLAAFAANGETPAHIAAGRAVARDAKTALVFSGNGAQWDGMGRVAFETSTSFRRHFRAVNSHYEAHTSTSLETLLFADDLAEQLVRTEIAQPLLFALQVALARSLQDQGLIFSATLGHSVGEVAAAHIAGALDLKQAVAVIQARSQHQELAAGKGRMAAVQAGKDEIEGLIASGNFPSIEIAAFNSPRSVTVSGTSDDIHTFAKFAETNHIAARVLDINYPFHSSGLDDVRAPLLEALSGLTTNATTLNMYSTVTGNCIDGEQLGANYWWDNVRQPVRFDAAVRACANAGHQIFVEIGPRSILRKYIADNISENDQETQVIKTLDTGDTLSHPPVRAALARAIVAGTTFEANLVFGEDSGKAVSLPLYAWQNKEYRFNLSTEAFELFNTQSKPHPLLGLQMRPDDFVWDHHLDTRLIPFLADHRVGGKAIMPGSGFVEMAINAASQHLGTKSVELRDFDLVQALELHDQESQAVRTRIDIESSTIEISSRPRLTDDERQTHARARYARLPSKKTPARAAPTLPAQTNQVIGSIYRLAEKFGLNYGPEFQRVTQCVEIGNNIIELALSSPELETNTTPGPDPYALHPIDFDACFHGLNVVFNRLAFGENKLAFVPVHIGRLQIFSPGHRVHTARIHLVSFNIRAIRADFELFDENGTLIAIAENVRFRASSLVHRLGLSAAAYHFDHIVRALPSAPNVSAAPSLSEILKATRHQLAPHNEAAHFEENQLLLDMAARRAAFDILTALANDGTISFGTAGASGADCGGDNDNARNVSDQAKWHSQSQDCQTVMKSLVSLLASCDLATPITNSTSWQLTPPHDCPLPALAEIIATVLRDDPAWSAECTLLLRAVDHLTSWFSVASSDTTIMPTGEGATAVGGAPAASEVFSSSALEHFYCASPLAQAQIGTVLTVLSAAINQWPAGRPLRILQLGIAAGGLSRRLLPLLEQLPHPHMRASLVVADTDETGVARLANLHFRTPGFDAIHVSATLEELSAHGPFDIVISANGLHGLQNCGVLLANLRQHMAQGAIAIISESQPTAFQDVVFAGTSGWFDTAMIDGIAYGRLRDSESWSKALRQAGFTETPAINAGHDQITIAGTSLIIARCPVSGVEQTVEVSEETAQPAARTRTSALLIAAGTDELSIISDLQKALTRTGKTAEISRSRDHATRVADIEFLFAQSDTPPDVVFISQATSDDQQSQPALLDQTSELASLLNVIGERPARIWIVAEGGARAIAGLGLPSPVQSGLWGFGRTALNEYPHLNIRLLDIGGGLKIDEAADHLQALIETPCDLREIIITPDALHGLQVRRGAPPVNRITDTTGAELSTSPATVLQLTQSGDLDSLQWTAHHRTTPGLEEVEIEVVATGLNFRDTMWSLGLLPEEALEDGFAGPTVGFECSGRVAAVGPDVTHLQVGDPVIAMAPACFASHVTVTTKAVARLPDNLALVDAATIPVAFLTAHYALDYLAHLRKGEWVLIHGAAGGVGLAAVQIAKQIGARIIATAGTDEKRAFLKTLGADHVLDTRSLEFVEDVKAITGAGVDVLLNSLAGEATERSIDLMRPFGRFLELGKRDFYANTKVGLRPFRRNVSYFGIDADQLLTYRPDVVAAIFNEIIEGFANGTYTPLPHRIFESAAVVDAFRLMQKSGHIGKIVVKAPAANSGMQFSNREFTANPDGTHIIVGGTGGFGLEMAGWLADRGARHILLTSRSGGSSSTLTKLTAALFDRGVDLRVARCDAIDMEALSGLLAAERQKRPIVGIAHAAMVLDDGLIRNLTADRIAAVLAPKVAGAHNLDLATRPDQLDYFILFSSSAALFGNPGQASYTAANGYLDGLARARAAKGLKATSVAWGAISDVGVLTRQKDTAESLARHTGDIEFKARDGLNLLARLMVRDDFDASCTNIALATMNWSMAADVLEIMQTPAYAMIRREAQSGNSDHGEQIDMRSAIEGLDDNAARSLLADYLAREVAAIFRMPVEDISLKRSLADIGMDSLMGLELRMAAQRGLGIDIPIVSISDGTTINDIASRVLTRLRSGSLENDAPSGERRAMMNKHVAEDIDDDTLDLIEKRVQERETGLQKVI